MKMMIVIAATLLFSAAAFSQTIVFGDDRTITLPKAAAEGQSTAVPPGDPDCQFGRVLATQEFTPGRTNTVGYRDLGGPDTSTHISTFIDGPAMTNDANYDWGTSDHDLVTLGNGDVLYLTAAFIRTPLNPKPKWFDSAYRLWFGPGARSILAVWRSTDCGKTFKYDKNLEFDSAKMHDGSCALPQGQMMHLHDDGTTPTYLMASDALPQAGDNRFRWCWMCQQLFLDDGTPSACPFGGTHRAAANYKVTKTSVANHVSETGFKVCKFCKTLYNANSAHLACPARRTHDDSGSEKYFLPAPSNGQFHRCDKCDTLFKDGSKAACPLGGRHAASGNYAPPLSSTNIAGESGWRMCSKCGALYRPTGTGNTCPNGSMHADAGTKFTMPTASIANSESGWRRCAHCGALYRNTGHQSRCPLVRAHDGTGSANFVLARSNGTDEANLQSGWRACTKCGSVHFSLTKTAGCPIGKPGEPAIYDMGGSDGQLVKADTANNRLYLTFQCVGRLPDTAFTDFQLNDTPVNKTLIAMADLGKPWRVIGVPGGAQWRIGVVPFDAHSFALGYSETIVRATELVPGGFSFEHLTGDATAGEWGWEGVGGSVPAYAPIEPKTWGHTVVARIPGTSNAALVMPDTVAGKGHGYRVFFHNQSTHSFTESEPVSPESKDGQSLAFHLQTVSAGNKGPSLLYWYDFDVPQMTMTIRGRFITGTGAQTCDFAISRADGKPRAFSVTKKTNYGDYQTAGGYAKPDGTFVFHPMWVEPDGNVHFGTVTYNPSGFMPRCPTTTAVKPVPKRVAVPLEQMVRSRQLIEAQREHRERRERD